MSNLCNVYASDLLIKWFYSALVSSGSIEICAENVRRPTSILPESVTNAVSHFSRLLLLFPPPIPFDMPLMFLIVLFVSTLLFFLLL